METKANINLKEGIVELIGSEEFVSKYLDIFKDFLMLNHEPTRGPIEEIKHERLSGAIKTNEKSNNGIGKKATKPTKAKAIPLEKFDIHEDKDILSLEDFLKEKVPGKTAANIIAVIAYYITKMKGIEYFSEGNIDYAYRTLSIPGRPTHLRQIIINAKNDKDFFEPCEEGKWKLTRTGEIFVDQKLSPNKK